MIVHLFRWRLRAGMETPFREAWTEVTTALRQRGSQGSALFRGADGDWYAIARWPDAATGAVAFEVRRWKTPALGCRKRLKS